MKNLVLGFLLCVAALSADLPKFSTSKSNTKCEEPCDPTKIPKLAYFQKGCTKWYAGAGISFADLFYYADNQNNNTIGTLFSDNDSDIESTSAAPSMGYNVYLGYSYNEYLDVELKGLQIVRPFTNNYRTDLSSTGDNDVYNGTTKLYFVSFGPYVLFNLPMYKVFTPFLRVGMVTDLVTFHDDALEDATFSTDGLISRGTQKSSLWLERLNVGIGFKSEWKDLVSVRAEYETPFSNNISDSATTNNFVGFYVPGVLSASVAFKF